MRQACTIRNGGLEERDNWCSGSKITENTGSRASDVSNTTGVHINKRLYKYSKSVRSTLVWSQAQICKTYIHFILTKCLTQSPLVYNKLTKLPEEQSTSVSNKAPFIHIHPTLALIHIHLLIHRTVKNMPSHNGIKQNHVIHAPPTTLQ